MRDVDYDLSGSGPPDPNALHESHHWVLEEDFDQVPPDPDPTCRRIPAGQVLLVMLVALCLGALFNADRMAERAREKSTDDAFRNESIWIWDRVQDVSELLRLDVPRSAIEDAIGR